MRSKKGQLGKLIASFPIMLLIFILMAIFLVISAGARITKTGTEAVNFLSINPVDDLMLKEIEMKVRATGEEDKYVLERMRVIDAIAIFISKGTSELNFKESLKKLMVSDSDRNCLGVALKSHTGKSFFFSWSGDEIDDVGRGGDFSLSPSPYYETNLVRTVTITAKSSKAEIKERIEYYYGRCFG